MASMLMGSNPKGPHKHGTNGFITCPNYPNNISYFIYPKNTLQLSLCLLKNMELKVLNV